MTLDEAIEHATDVAGKHRQIAAWLEELKDWRELSGKKHYEPPTMKVVEIGQGQRLLCGSNPYWDDCDQPKDDGWWGK